MKHCLFKIGVIIVLFASQVYAGDLYTTKNGCIAAVYIDDLNKAMSYISDNDIEAMESLVASNRVFILKPGLRVFISEIRTFKGVVKIRLKGTGYEVWTTLEAIKK